MNHYIIVKFQQDIADREHLYREIEGLFARSTELDGIHRVQIHRSSIDLPNRHDLMIHMEMEPQALPAFDSSWIHREWKERFGEFLVNKTIFDCN